MGKLKLLAVVLLLTTMFGARQADAATFRVGVQAGHWRSNELPDELKTLRGNTGASAGGYQEVTINLDIAQRTAAYLQQAGVAVDLLPATVPPSYQADAFVAIHADGNGSSALRGYKIAGHWRDWDASQALIDALRVDYGAASNLPWDGDHISSGMRGYYAFSSGRFEHSVANATPSVILELGYLTNPRDRALLTQQADRLARGVAQGILRFLRSKPAGGWPAPPPLPEYRATVTATIANVRSGPGTQYPIVRTLKHNQTLLAERVEGDWVLLSNSRRNRGSRWVHLGNIQLTRLRDEAPQAP